MKIKQIGSIPKNTDDNNNVNPGNSSKRTKLLFISSGILLLLICSSVYFFVIRNNYISSNNFADSLMIKELELKEKEINLKEQQLDKSSNEKDVENIKNTVYKLISAFNSKNSSIDKYYYTNVNYYSWGLTDRSKVIKDKIAFYNRWDFLNMNVDNFNVTRQPDDSYRCEYDKALESSNYTNGKNLSVKVRSVLIFRKESSEWLISEERDDKTYYLNKNY